MIIPQSPAIILHRLALAEARTLEASHALVAKYRGDMMIREAIERLETPEPAAAGNQVNKSA